MNTQQVGHFSAFRGQTSNWCFPHSVAVVITIDPLVSLPMGYGANLVEDRVCSEVGP